MCLYWAIALIAFLWNTVYTANSIRHHIFQNKPAITSCIIHLNHPCSIPSNTNVYKDEVTTLVAVIAIVPSAVFIELLVSIYAVKYFISQRSQRYGHHCNFWKQYIPAANSSCACTVEYFDSTTNNNHGSSSSPCPTINVEQRLCTQL